MRRPLIAGNWKMHGSRAENAELIEALLLGLPGQTPVEIARAADVVGGVGALDDVDPEHPRRIGRE